METTTTTASGLLGTLLPAAVLIILLYFMLIRPQQKEQKKHAELINGLRKGNRVILSSGIHGEICEIKDNVMLVNIADTPGTELIVRVGKYSVQSVMGKDNEAKPKEDN